MTDGILLRMWNKLKNGDIVILDEAHERRYALLRDVKRSLETFVAF